MPKIKIKEIQPKVKIVEDSKEYESGLEESIQSEEDSQFQGFLSGEDITAMIANPDITAGEEGQARETSTDLRQGRSAVQTQELTGEESARIGYGLSRAGSSEKASYATASEISNALSIRSSNLTDFRGDRAKIAQGEVEIASQLDRETRQIQERENQYDGIQMDGQSKKKDKGPYYGN